MKSGKIKILAFIIICSLIIGFIIIYNKDEGDVKSVIIDVEDGYGYEISYKEKLIIKQEFIPAITKKQSFSSKDDARKIAFLVVKRLKNKEMPYIHKDELDSLQIKIR